MLLKNNSEKDLFELISFPPFNVHEFHRLELQITPSNLDRHYRRQLNHMYHVNEKISFRSWPPREKQVFSPFDEKDEFQTSSSPLRIVNDRFPKLPLMT